MTFQNTNVPGYKKDQKTGVVINNNESELMAVRNHRKAFKDKKKLEEQVQTLEKELNDQKEMIQRVLYEVGLLKGGADK